MLDFFRRGEVARDVRMLAAQGAIAPRPLEQLGILMLLTSDGDSEVRDTAEQTLQSAAGGSDRRLHRALRRADRDARVLRQARHPAVRHAGAGYRRAACRHQIETGLGPRGRTEDEKAQTFQQRLANMTVPEKVKCAIEGHARDARDPDSRSQPHGGGGGAELPEGQRGRGRGVREDGQRVGRDSPHDRDEPRLDEELRRGAGAGEELQDAGGAVA